MKRVGAHVGTTGGIENAPLNASEINAKAFALFVKNQRQWHARPLESKSVEKFRENCQAHGYSPEHILAHDSYLINLGNPFKEKRQKSLDAFMDEMSRLEILGLRLLNFHPGAHLKEISEEKCLDLIAGGINKALGKYRGITAVIENTAGQGSNVGYRFEHLAYLIDKTEDKSRIGVCLDTCHTYSAGYDIRTKSAFTKIMNEFDKIVGMKYLKGMHLNDSKVDFASRKDRHQSLGKGTLGLDAFKFIMKDKRFDDMPLILETIDHALWAEEIKLLYSFVPSPPAWGERSLY